MLKRTILALCAIAILIPLVGCGHHKCCKPSSSSFAPPPGPCCDQPRPPAYLPASPG